MRGGGGEKPLDRNKDAAASCGTPICRLPSDRPRIDLSASGPGLFSGTFARPRPLRCLPPPFKLPSGMTSAPPRHSCHILASEPPFRMPVFLAFGSVQDVQLASMFLRDSGREFSVLSVRFVQTSFSQNSLIFARPRDSFLP